MTKKAGVSVLTITYGHEAYIAETIEGVLDQEVDFPVEMIIADDCSPDHTEEVVRGYIENHPNGHWIRYTKHKNNKGVNLNFIWAFEQCQAKYIALCEGDDYWTDPLKLQKQVDFLEKNVDFAACYHDTSVIDEKGKKIRNSKWGEYRDHSQEDLLFSKGEMITNAVMFRNEIADLSLMQYVVNGDTFLFHKIGEIGGGGFLSSIGPSCYRIHGGGIWSLKSELFKLKSAVETYDIIIQSLNRNNYFNAQAINEKSMRLVNSFMIQQLRIKRLGGYLKGWDFVISKGPNKILIFIKIHLNSLFKSAIQLFIK